MVVLEKYYLSHLKAQHIQQRYVKDAIKALEQEIKAST